jgi:hypothetical protein
VEKEYKEEECKVFTGIIHINKTICWFGIVKRSKDTSNDLPTRSVRELAAQSTRTFFLERVVRIQRTPNP